MKKANLKENNLDILRLIFASQVMVYHGAYHLLGQKWHLLDYLPGVPAFFFVSGFLIYAAYQRSDNIKVYAENRFLRLFPGLCLVTLGGGIVVLYAKGSGFFLDNIAEVITWAVAQLTLGQAYNPAIFRDIGVGVINGALWTISVEILFYIIVPVIAFFKGKFKPTIVLLTALSFLVYWFSEKIGFAGSLLGKSISDYLMLTPLYWGWMFGIGMLAYTYINIIPIKRGWALAALAGCCLMVFLDIDNVWFRPSSNHLGVVYYLLYIYVIMYLSFGLKPKRLKFDISYGVYIWHMPVVNFLLVASAKPTAWTMFVFIVISLVVSLMSWYMVEVNFLRLKKKTMHAY